ncbi:MAG: hypothetical protein U5L09_09800 [Bacteroidales bacterium]|nr:hypothetical protein [Bacteroidales bacterium]
MYKAQSATTRRDERRQASWEMRHFTDVDGNSSTIDYDKRND